MNKEQRKKIEEIINESENPKLRACAEQASSNQVWVKSNDGRKILVTFLDDVTNIYIDSKLKNDISPIDLKMTHWIYKE